MSSLRASLFACGIALLASACGGSSQQAAPPPVVASASESAVTAAPASVIADGSASAVVTVTLRTAARAPVAGRAVSLSSSRGATDTISAASGLSDPSGVVTFAVTSTTAGTASLAAVDVTDGVAILLPASAGFVAGPAVDARSTVAATPASVVADGTASSTVTVTLRDAYGNAAQGRTVTLASSRGAADAISGSGPSSASGVVTFAVRSTTAGAATLTAFDPTDAVTLSQTAPVAFAPGAVSAARSTVAASPAAVTADGSAASTLTVTLRDAYGNAVPGKTVALASSRGAADTISAASGPSGAAGVVTFAVRSTTAGSPAFTATDATDALQVTQTASVTFTRYLVFTTQPPASVGGGTPLSPPPVVRLQDASGNVDATFGGNVTIAIGSNPGGGTLTGTAVVAASAGVATFSGLSVDKPGKGYTLVASDPVDGLAPAASRAFDVVVGPPAKLGFTLQPSNSGGGIGPTFQVSVYDAGGNPTTPTGYPITVAIGTNPSGGVLTAPPTATLTSSSVNGVATFTGLGIAGAGAGYTLVASDAVHGLTPATSAPFDVKAPTVVGNGTATSCTEAALNAALASGGNVTFSCGASPATITLTSTKTVSVNTSLDGGGLVTLSGGGAVQLFSINAGVTMALSNLTVTGGRTAGAGGAVANFGTLLVTRCTFSGNSAIASNGSASYSGDGGAIYSRAATLVVASSTFSGNAASMSTDVRGVSGNGGAIFTWSGVLLAADSTFSGNTAFGSNAIQGADGNGGAVFVDAGGSAAFTSCTFAGNGASATGGVGSTGGLGGAIWAGGAVTLTNTILAAGPSGANCQGTITNGGHDLDSDGSCGVGPATNPLLSAAGLASNGGPTQTIAVQAGSPAIGAGDHAVCAAAPVIGLDQRGVARGATTCTIGALEDPAH